MKILFNDLKKLYSFIKKLELKKRTIAITLFFVFIVNITSLAQPYLLGKIIDSINQKKINNIKVLIFAMSILFILGVVFFYFQNLFIIKVISNLEIENKKKMFLSIVDSDFNKFNNYDKGTILNSIEQDSMVISNLLNQNIDIFMSFINIAISGVVLFSLQYKLALILLIIFPINFIFFMKMGELIKNKELELKKSHDSYMIFLTETLQGLKNLKIFNVEKKRLLLFENKNKELYNIGIDKVKIETNTSIFINISSYISNIVILIFGIFLIFKGEFSIGLLVSFNSYSSRFKSELNSLSNLNFIIKNMVISLDRISNILELKLSNKIKRSSNFNFEKIEIKSLNFKYNEETSIFEGSNFAFKKGNLYFLSGESGRGKTTLLNIISGLENEYTAKIYIDGNQYKDFKEISNSISYVDQENFIFTDTVYNNITLYRNISKEDVINVCISLNIHDAIMALPNGYDSIIKSDGIDLSGGQKQRICIGRSLVDKNKTIYLFDEVTSSLDSKTYKDVLSILHELSKKSIVIISSHLNLIELLPDAKAIKL